MACAKAYRDFCQRYTPKQKKTTPRQPWGSRFLAKMQAPTQGSKKSQVQAMASGQMTLPLTAPPGTYQVDPLGSWFGSKAAQAFIVANGAAAMS